MHDLLVKDKSKTANQIVLEIKEITSGYGKKNVLENLSLDCFPGEIHGILGWNGAGKTTFFNTVFGFLRLSARTPSEKNGEILLDGRPISKHDISFLETEPFFYPNLRGREYLELLSGQKTKNFEKWKAIFDLPLEDLVNGYSTGTMKKLAIAGTFLQGRKVMLLDEPFNGLDLESAEKLSWLLEDLKKTGEKTVLISSHILPTLTRICDKISRLEGGKIIETCLPGQFLALETELKNAVHQKLSGLVS